MLLALLRRVLPSDWSEDIVRDLEEAHRRERANRGPLRADVWLAGQVVRFAGRFALERRPWRTDSGGEKERLASLTQDVRLTFRSLLRVPVFSLAVIATLAVGVGANAAVFSVVRGVLLKPLPYPHSDRLVVAEPSPWVPAEIVEDVRRRSPALEEVAGFYPLDFTVTGAERPEGVHGAVVTPDLLTLLGADMALGRAFTDKDARPDAPRTAILSHADWERSYGASPAVIGRSIRLDGVPHEIIGVMSAGFRQLTPRTGEVGVWTPAGMDRLGADVLPEGSISWAIPVARLAAGVPRERAQAELDAALDRYRERHPEAVDGPIRRLRWAPLRSNLTHAVRNGLLVLQAAVGLLLLLSCVNVANLLLVRFDSRRGEVAVRSALGASRVRLLRQLVTESVMLAIAGGLAGLVLRAAFLELMLAVAPPDLPRIGTVSDDGSIVFFTMALAIVAGLAFGTIPALAATRESPQQGLKESGRVARRSGSRQRLSRALVVAQVALTLMLVVSATLLVRSFVALSDQDPGFGTDGVVAVRMSVPEDRYESMPLLVGYLGRLVGRVQEVPGVGEAAVSNNLPLWRGNAIRSFVIDGESEVRDAQYGVVSADYFRTLGIPLLRGRPFGETDGPDAPRVAIVDEAFAERAWPGQDAIGKRLRFEDGRESLTVVGVCGDIRGYGLAAAPEPGLYIPYAQRPATPVEVAVGKNVVLLVRLQRSADTGEAAQALRQAVWDVEPGQPVPEITPLAAILSDSTRPQRFRATLLAAFAAVALLIAIAGIYGVVGHVLAQRTGELAIRRALGASDREAVRLVLGWGLRLAGVGIVLGGVGVVWAGRLIRGLLFGIEPTDPGTLLAGAVTVLLITLVACAVPAYRATRVDALVAMRSE